MTPCVVLVVDDEPAVLAMTALRLWRAGYDALDVSYIGTSCACRVCAGLFD